MRLLLVEDDPMLGNSLKQALQAQHYVVDWVQTGLSALTALQTEHFDLAVMDLGLPGLDGVRVIEEVRDQRLPLPILILTARDSVEDRVRGLDAGADDYLLKPFDLNELLARLRALGRRNNAAVAVKSDTCNTKYTVKYLSEAPEPPSGGACGRACPGGSDSECAWVGGANSCTKCDTTPGTRFTCVAP